MNKIIIGFMVTAVIVTSGWGICAFAGDLDSPGDPSTDGRMYTVEQVYDYLTDVDSAPPTKATGAFDEPDAAPTSGTMHTLDDIFAELVRLPATGQTTSYTTGDDGYTEMGATLSYTYSDDGTIDTEEENVLVDDNTGLMWIRDCTKVTGSGTGAGGDQDISGAMNWGTALTSCGALTYNGYSDWRVPNIKELISIMDFSSSGTMIDTTAFPNTSSDFYASSTTDPDDTSKAFASDFDEGESSSREKTGTTYVRAVRGGK